MHRNRYKGASLGAGIRPISNEKEILNRRYFKKDVTKVQSRPGGHCAHREQECCAKRKKAKTFTCQIGSHCFKGGKTKIRPLGSLNMDRIAGPRRRKKKSTQRGGKRGFRIDFESSHGETSHAILQRRKTGAGEDRKDLLKRGKACM